jgi:hypothetical protein
MKRTEIIKSLKNNLHLIPKGYLFFEEEGFNGVPITIIKREANFVFRIDAWVDKSNSYSEFNSSIYFKQIDDVLNPLLVKHKMIAFYSEENNCTILLKRVEPDLFSQTLNPTYPKVIDSEADIISLLKDMNEYTENVAEPFFEKWSDLRVLNDFMETVPQMELENYINNGVYAKALVYKLCNNPSFEEYFNLIYKYTVRRYIDNPNGDKSYKQQHDLIIELKEILDRTKAIYNV